MQEGESELLQTSECHTTREISTVDMYVVSSGRHIHRGLLDSMKERVFTLFFQKAHKKWHAILQTNPAQFLLASSNTHNPYNDMLSLIKIAKKTPQQ